MIPSCPHRTARNPWIPDGHPPINLAVLVLATFLIVRSIYEAAGLRSLNRYIAPPMPATAYGTTRSCIKGYRYRT